jgi:hypothetical protein
MRLLPAILALVVLTLTGSPATAWASAREIHRFYGYAFDQATGRFLYSEVHRQVYQGDLWIGGTIRYHAPDLRLIGEKTLDFARDPFIPLFHLSLPQEGYEEGITAVDSTGIEARKTVGGKHSEARIERTAEMVADSGFHSFVVRHLDELQQERTVSFDFAVAGRLASYRFRLKKMGEGSHEGHPTLQIQAEPDSLLRLLVPPLVLVYDLTTHYLIEYRGVSNLHDPATGKAYSAVRIIYPLKPPPGVPALLPPLDTD